VIAAEAVSLALTELRAAPCFRFTGFLALNSASIASKQLLAFKGLTKWGVEALKRLGDAV